MTVQVHSVNQVIGVRVSIHSNWCTTLFGNLWHHILWRMPSKLHLSQRKMNGNKFKPKKSLFFILVLIYYFKKHFKRCFYILKTLKDILQHFKFMNW